MLHHIFPPFQDPKSTRYKLPLFFQMHHIEREHLLSFSSLVAKVTKVQKRAGSFLPIYFTGKHHDSPKLTQFKTADKTYKITSVCIISGHF